MSFTISLSNMTVTTQGLGGGTNTGAVPLEWPTLEEARAAAVVLNAKHGLNAYIHPTDHSDRCVDAVLTHTFGYASDS